MPPTVANHQTQVNSMPSRPLDAWDTALSRANAKAEQTRERAHAIASLLANFDEVNLHAASFVVRDHYLRVAFAALRMARNATAPAVHS